jgi:hypothetical protein
MAPTEQPLVIVTGGLNHLLRRDGIRHRSGTIIRQQIRGSDERQATQTQA